MTYAPQKQKLLHDLRECETILRIMIEMCMTEESYDCQRDLTLLESKIRALLGKDKCQPEEFR